MNNLYTIINVFNNGYFPGILFIFSSISVILGILVITIKNPIVSVLFLIGLFSNIACYLISIGASFIGISYLLVYVGAVSILFLFILMLINIRVSELITETKNSIPLIIIITFMFQIAYAAIFSEKIWLYDMFNDSLNNVTYSNWENTLAEFTHISSIGNIMYTNYSILLLIASFILLLAMIGAIVITVKQSSKLQFISG